MPNKYEITHQLDVLSPEYEQFQKLVIQFIIDQYIRNDSPYVQANHQKQKEYIQQAIEEYQKWTKGENDFHILSAREIKEEIDDEVKWIMKEVNHIIADKQKDNYQKRFYWLKDNNQVIGFQKATVEKGQNSTIGWRNLAFTDPQYAGKIVERKNQKGQKEKIFVSSLLYEEIDKWFKESGVTIERTITGVHMLSNIQLYMIGLGFIPKGKQDDMIYFQKDKNRPYAKPVLKKIYQMYEENSLRPHRKSYREIETEIEQIEEFKELPQETKKELISIFLKEKEKGPFRKFRESIRLKGEDKLEEDKIIRKELYREEKNGERTEETER